MRAAIRLLVRRPGYSLLAILTLAIGLGVNAVAFSAVNALVFRAYRTAGDTNIGWVFVGTRSQPWGVASLPAFERIRSDTRTLASLVAEGRMPLAYDTGGQTEQIWALVVSPDYFATVNVPLTFGRIWRADEAAGPGVPVLIGEHFWHARFGGSTNLSALSLTLNRQRAYVVGVVDDDFEDPGGVYAPDVFVPLTARIALGFPPSYGDRSTRWLTLLGRPKAGATPDTIAAEVLPLARDDASLAKISADDVRVSFGPLTAGNPALRELRRVSAIGLAAVGLVLLIACFNVAGLLLARSVERQRELGIRAALGAGRLRLVGDLLWENLALAALACVAALVVARWSGRLLAVFSLPAPIPERLNFPNDWRLRAYTIALSIAAAVVPAIAPAWQVWRGSLISWLRAQAGAAGGRRETRLRRAFVMTQTAGSTLFLAIALLFGRSFVHALTFQPGFDLEHTAMVAIDPVHYGYTPDRTARLVEELRRRLAQLPGVRDVSAAERLPFFVGFDKMIAVSLDGRDCRASRCPDATSYDVDDAFFRTLGIPFRGGRAFASDDDPDAVIVSEAAARQFWPGRDAIGQVFSDGARRRLVVGVAADVAQRTFTKSPRPHVYTRLRPAELKTGVNFLATGVNFVVSTQGRPADLILSMREAVHAVEPALPVQSATTMDERMALPQWLPRTIAGFFGVCGVVAVLLASVGLFGVTYYVVMQRAREFGVRLAIGATPADLRRLVAGEALRLVTPGVLIGVVTAVAARGLVFGVSPLGPGTYLAAALIQAAVALTASAVPAFRAARVDPLHVLRAE